MSIYDDLLPELEHAKKYFEEVYAKDIPKAAEAVTDHCSFNLEWFSEPMPLENREGTALEQDVRQMIADSVDKEEAPEMPKVALPQSEDVLVFADQLGLCQRILEKAPEGRVGSKKIVTKPASMITQEDLDSLLGMKTWDLILVGLALDPPRSNNVPDILEQQNAVAKFCLFMFQTCFKKDGCCKRMAFLTHDIFSEEEETHREKGLSITTGSIMYGMCNTARMEMEFPIHLIDTELIDCRELVPHLAAEVFRMSTFGVNTVRHCYPFPIRYGKQTNRPAGRYVARQVTTHNYQTAGVKFQIPHRGVIAISGGNGALGLVMGLWLLDTAEKHKAEGKGAYDPKFTIQFLSRSAKVSDLNMPNWRKIQQKAEELGITVEQANLDMSSQAAVDEYLAKVTPNLIGFIHSAGILQDSMIPNQSWEKFEGVYSSKHWAALYLHDGLERYANPDLKFFWMFSSTSVYGNMGQLNYSSSNSCLDALARHRLALGKPAAAIQWGAWGEVGMAATMDDAMRRRVMMGPMPYFTVKQGLEGLEGGLRTGLPGFTVFIVNPPVYFGMIQGDTTAGQRYGRNFSSEYIPTPAPSSLDKDQTYNIYRMYRYIMFPYSNTIPLIWNKYIRPMLRTAHDEEDDSTIEFGYGLAWNPAEADVAAQLLRCPAVAA